MYKYPALPAGSIHLLRVLSSSNNGCVRIELHTFGAPKPYKCLSYMWGESDKNQQIRIDDEPHTVRANLFSFLKVAANHWSGKWLWIDALCIDQSDNQERGHQVQRMGDIYREATEVLVWLHLDESLTKFFGAHHQRIPHKDLIRCMKHSYWYRG
jgi:hypothetical protein